MISREEIVDRVRQVAEPLVEDEQLELVDIEFQTTGNRWLLRIYIDREGGVRISDCEHVSRELSRLLDVEDIIDHPFVLEVSSPGLTRPLRKKEDFIRYRGKKCRVITRTPVEGKNDVQGEIVGVSAEDVEVKVDTTVYKIPINIIKKANLEFEL
jgi:ribosome maturation factor RimP